MKGSLFLITASAALALAGPIEKRMQTTTQWVEEIVTVTVTAGQGQGGIFAESSTTTTVAPQPEISTIVRQPTKKKHWHTKPKTTQVSTTQQPQTTTVEAQPEPEPTTTTTKKASESATEPTTTASETQPESSSNLDSPTSSDNYIDVVLHHHNIHRSNHSSPALEWNATLAQWAANTAKGCVFEHDMDQGDGNYGQNLAASYSSGDISDQKNHDAASGITDMFYNGEFPTSSDPYGPDRAGADYGGGHFTQVLWKSSSSVGCASILCPKGGSWSSDMDGWYTVCNYFPAGNMAGAYGDNVLPPLGHPIVTV